ncbi:MAG TPA: hypothetical protein VGR89_06075 [Puia sp.]|nr:hypothetical protein [Puia sp.]
MVIFSAGLTLACNQRVVIPHQVIYGTNTSKDTTPVSNPKKSITSFVITAADNPGVITSDVVGDIWFDTVRLVFDRGTNISNLVPTIAIVGKSISPASQVPEDFDSALVYIVTATDGSILHYRISVARK